MEEATKRTASKQKVGDVGVEVDAKKSRTGEDTSMVLGTLRKMLKSVDVCEMYSAPRVAEEAKKYLLKAGESMDLTTGWDFSKATDRRRAERYLEEKEPLLVIGSPECKMFSSLQNLTPWTEEEERRYTEARVHIAFCMKNYEWQTQKGRLFLH